MRTLLSAATAVVLALTIAAAPATAATVTSDRALPAGAAPAVEVGTEKPGGEVVGGPVAPSPYIEAESEADAAAKFAALDAGGVSALAASVTFGPCTLYPSVMYLRASSNYGAVGTKPYTRCEVPVTSIRHSTDMRYKSFIWWRKAGTTKTGGNSGVASYTQRNVEYYCVSRESTAWTGTTAGTIVYRGKTYYARVYQPVKTLACGG